MRILITGSEGVIGSVLQKSLQEHQLVLLDKTPSEHSVGADISDLGDIAPHFNGVETVIHLAADKRNYLDWKHLVKPNVTGTRNVYEASKQGGVTRVIFASSLNVYPWERIFASGKKITERTPTSAQNDYGLTKILGEEIGRDCHARHGISVINLRLGSINKNNKPNNYEEGQATPVDYAHWLSEGDMVRVVGRCVEFRGYASVPWCSKNKQAFIDFTFPERVLGIRPEDSSEKFE